MTPLIADLFLCCYERDFMDSLNHDNQADVIEAFNSTSRYLDDLLNIDNPYFEGMVKQIYPRPELQLNKANNTDTEAPFLDLHLSIANVFVSSKINDKLDDFDFDIANIPFLDGDVPRRAPYFEGMVKQIYARPELQLNKANNTDTEAPFLDLHLSIANVFVSSKINDKLDDFDFDIANIPFLDGDVPRRASYGVYISQLTCTRVGQKVLS